MYWCFGLTSHLVVLAFYSFLISPSTMFKQHNQIRWVKITPHMFCPIFTPLVCQITQVGLFSAQRFCAHWFIFTCGGNILLEHSVCRLCKGMIIVPLNASVCLLAACPRIFFYSTLTRVIVFFNKLFPLIVLNI